WQRDLFGLRLRLSETWKEERERHQERRGAKEVAKLHRLWRMTVRKQPSSLATGLAPSHGSGSQGARTKEGALESSGRRCAPQGDMDVAPPNSSAFAAPRPAAPE